MGTEYRNCATNERNQSEPFGGKRSVNESIPPTFFITKKKHKMFLVGCVKNVAGTRVHAGFENLNCISTDGRSEIWQFGERGVVVKSINIK